MFISSFSQHFTLHFCNFQFMGGHHRHIITSTEITARRKKSHMKI